MHLEFRLGDITTAKVDAIVNAANSSLLGGGGVDGAIHRAGGAQILRECQELRASEYADGLPTGQAVATTAGHLDAKIVIHTVGPVFTPTEDRSAQLASAYRESLRVATDHGCRSIAFPAISTGVYGYPLAEAAQIAVAVVKECAQEFDLVRFVLFSPEALAAFEAAGQA